MSDITFLRTYAKTLPAEKRASFFLEVLSGKYEFAKYNENHDEQGRFTSGDGSSADTSYRMAHQAPERSDNFGAPATDVASEMMPNFYEHPEWYAQMSGNSDYAKADRESVAALMAIKDNPEATVTIYRAVPAGVDKINQGDWVTLSRTYADLHAAGNIQGEAKILSQDIKAKDLWFDGNSVNEFGYDPQGAKALAKALFQKYNENHDELGRFSSGDGVSSSEASDLASQAMGGGFSYNPTTHSAPTSGFMVARVGATVSVPAGNLQEARDGLKSFINEHIDMFKSDPNLHIGGWVSDGKLWIEPADNVSSIEHATSLGGARDQIAIWDVVNGQEINTGGTGGANAKEGSNDPNFGKALRSDSRQLGRDDRGREERLVRGFSEEIWNVLKYNENHDELGRFASGDGSGSGSSSHAVTLAKGISDRAKAIEPKVTADMKSLADKHGAEMSGLDFRLKTEESLTDKINRDAANNYYGDKEAAAENISDANRYTMVVSPENYTEVGKAVEADLKAQGYEVRTKNYWNEESNYKGVNMALKDPSGNKIELQFHTPDSLRVKMEDNHGIYKEYQALSPERQSSPIGQAMNQAMIDNLVDVAHPVGIDSWGIKKIGKSLLMYTLADMLGLKGETDGD